MGRSSGFAVEGLRGDIVGAGSYAIAWGFAWKINNLGGNLNAFDYIRIISGLSPDYIIYYLPPPLGDYLDYVGAFFRQKRGSPPRLEDPPHQNFRPLVF